MESSRSPASSQGRRLALVGLACASGVAALLTLLVQVESAAMQSFDDAVVRFTRSWADAWGWPVTLAHEIDLRTGVVFSSFVAGLFALFLLARRRWAAAFFLMMSAFIGGLIGGLFKYLVARDRPPGAEKYETDLTDSFPSGHTMVGIYLYLASGLLLLRIGQVNGRGWMVRLGWAFIVFGPALGMTRVIVGAHWPTDVIAGWAFGSAVVLLSALVFWDSLDQQWPTWKRREKARSAALPAAGQAP